jgi:hypothetical protein
MAVTRRRPLRPICLLALLTAGFAAAAGAQQPDSIPGTPWIVTVSHWGRWPALAGAGGLVAMAAVRNGDARAARTALEDFCAVDPGRCALTENPDGSGGWYVDPEAEALYQEYARLSRSAQGYLIGGQVSLLVAGGMFLIDLLHRDGDFGNIPYTPLELYTTPNRLGLAMRF